MSKKKLNGVKVAMYCRVGNDKEPHKPKTSPDAKKAKATHKRKSE